jgi:hypothetical protein
MNHLNPSAHASPIPRQPPRRAATLLASVAAALALGALPAHAHSLATPEAGGFPTSAATAASTSLVSQSILTRGSSSFSFDLSTTGAGTFEIRLADLGWPERLAGLSFSLSTPTAVLRTLQAPGLLTYQVGSAGSYFGTVSTRTQGSLAMGMFSLDVGFSPSAVPVPLPASGWLMLAAAATLAGALHRGGSPGAMKAPLSRDEDGVDRCGVAPLAA